MSVADKKIVAAACAVAGWAVSELKAWRVIGERVALVGPNYEKKVMAVAALDVSSKPKPVRKKTGGRRKKAS